jgi:hypothetical protein
MPTPRPVLDWRADCVANQKGKLDITEDENGNRTLPMSVYFIMTKKATTGQSLIRKTMSRRVRIALDLALAKGAYTERDGDRFKLVIPKDPRTPPGLLLKGTAAIPLFR